MLKIFSGKGYIKEYLKKAYFKSRAASLRKLRVPFYEYSVENSLYMEDIIRQLNIVLNIANEKEIELYTELFEKEFAGSCGAKYAVGLSSGTTALVYSLKAAGIADGDEVLLPPNTYIATAMAVHDAGAKPVFVDIDPVTFNMDTEKIPDKITKKTRAIIPVHLYGHMVDMNRIYYYADKYGLTVIEDACQAHGAGYKGSYAGTFGLTGCFSLHISKMVGTLGEGGAIVTDDYNIYSGIKSMCEPFSGIGSLAGKRTPARLSYIHSAICRAKLSHTDESLSKKNEIASIYRDALSGAGGITLPPSDPDYKDCYRNFTIRTKRRKNLMNYLMKNGIETRIFYKMPIHLTEVFSHLGYKRGDFPESESFAEETLSLPIGLHVSKDDAQFVAKKIITFYS